MTPEIRMKRSAPVVAALLLCVTGCDSDAKPRQVDEPTAEQSNLPSSVAEQVWAAVARVPTGSAYVGHLALVDDTTVFAFADAPDRDYADSIGVWRADEERIRRLATTAYPRGTVSGAAFDGTTVVYVDIDRLGSTDGAERVQWTIRSVGVDGKAPQVLAASPPGGSVLAPWVNVGDGRFMWTVWEKQTDPWAGRRVYEWEPGNEDARVLRRGIWLNDAAIPVPGGMVFTRTEPKNQWPSGMYKSDAYLWRTGKTEQENLSRSGLVLDVDATGDRVSWTEVHPSTTTEGTRVDPYAVFTMGLDVTESAVKIEEGYRSGNLIGGDGWVGWWTEELDLEIARLDDGTTHVLPLEETFVPARPDGDGESLVVGRTSEGEVVLERFSTAH